MMTTTMMSLAGPTSLDHNCTGFFFFFFQHGFWVPVSLCWGHCLMQLTFIGGNTAISLKHLPFDLLLLLYGSKTMISFKTPNISITEKQNCNGKWVCFLLEYRKILK